MEIRECNFWVTDLYGAKLQTGLMMASTMYNKAVFADQAIPILA